MFRTLVLVALLVAPGYAQTTVRNSTLVNASSTDPAVVGQINCGIAYLQFYLDANPIGPQITSVNTTITDPPNNYSFLWDSKSVPNGSYYLTVRAYDKAGPNGTCDGTAPNMQISAPIFITVVNLAPDTTPPNVTIYVPTSGAVITTKSQPIQVAASDESHIRQVVLRINGQVKQTLNDQGTINYLWNTSPYKGTSVLIEASATDVFNLTGLTSTRVTVRK